MNILCLGAVLCDIAAKPVPPDAFAARRINLDSLNVSGGGDANNASIDLARLGENVRTVSRVGKDFLGGMLLSQLRENGVDTRYVQIDGHAQTTAAVLMLGPDGVTVVSARKSGACDALCQSDVSDEALAWADHLHTVNVLNMPALDGEGLAALFARAHARGVTTSVDVKRPRNAHEHPMDCIREALGHCDVFLPSDHEVDYLCGISDPREAAEYFHRFGVKVFGMKRGKDGVYVTDYQQELFQPSLYRGTPVDVVGAGDAFSSTFVASWRRGRSLKDAALLASAASARVLSCVGTTAGMRDARTLARDVQDAGFTLDRPIESAE